MELLKETYTQIGKSLKELLPDRESFLKVILEIERSEQSIDYSGFYVDANGQKNWLNTNELKLDDKYIHQIHSYITGLGNKKEGWKRAIFRMFSGSRYDMDYIWE